MRANKLIGSSLETNISIKLQDELFKIADNYDFSEICITSKASVENDNTINDKIEVTTSKAEGEKCPVCWKVSLDPCKKHGKIQISK